MFPALKLTTLALLVLRGALGAPSADEASTTQVASTAADSSPSAAANGTALGPVPLAVGGFSRSCTSWGGTFGNQDGHGVAVLQATCFAINGALITSTLDLNGCMTNSFGNVFCAVGGAWLNSCTVSNRLDTGNTILDVVCGNGAGEEIPVDFDVNICVGNLNGRLAC